MSERSDSELLREYANTGEEAPFREVVLRHTDLLFSAALRQVGSPDLARDVLQKVFTDLARKSAQGTLSPEPGQSVLGWLYRSTRYEALDLLRERHRRESRELRAMQHPDYSPDDPVDWSQLQPILDEAMSDLPEIDRQAILLRFFRNQDLASVGRALGITDDAAQKRVGRALERLRRTFGRRGITTTALALSTALVTHSVHAAPAGLALSLSNSAVSLAGLAATAGTLSVSKLVTTVTMTTTKKLALGTLLAAAIGTGVYESREASRWRQAALALQADNSSLSNRLDSAAKERTPAVRNDAALQAERDRLQRATAELLKLRGENARLRAVEQQLAQLKPATEQPRDAFTQSVLDLTTKAAALNGHLEKSPNLRIPELALLKESDWIEVARRAKLNSEEDMRESLMALRGIAKHNAYPLWQQALKSYLDANGGEAPPDIQALRPYFNQPIDDAILQRYRVVHSGPVPANPTGPVWLIEESGTVDDRYDTRMRMGLGSLDISPIRPGR